MSSPHNTSSPTGPTGPVKRVLGIDPGPTPGIVMIDASGHELQADVVQCSARTAGVVLDALLTDHRHAPTVVAIEKFVARGRANAAQRLTADMVGEFERLALDHRAFVVLRSASEVKPWATDARLEASGLLAATKGMRHAKDAARHALFTAVKHGVLPDPLSQRKAQS